jgi:hypothetical protein
MWWTKGMSIPPLVTTSPEDTDRDDAGVLGITGTEVVFGDTRILEETRSGGRLVVGAWRDPCRMFGVEGEYLALGNVGSQFEATSDGDPILARPFYNALTREQDSELVAYPGVVEGTVGVSAVGRFTSAGVRFRWNRWCDQHCAQPMCGPSGCCLDACCPGYERWDLILGYRFMRVDESLNIWEDLVSNDPDLPADFRILDIFDTENDFHGGEFGLVYETQYNRWSLEMLAKIALGNSHQVVYIDGSTDIDYQDFDFSESYNSGILTQRTNIGTYSRDRFAVVPEVGATLGYQLNRRLKFTFGYSFIYWSRVARPGDQIDLVLNPNLFAPEKEDAEPFGPDRPAFAWHDTGFWAQGMSFGLEYRW